MEKNMTNFSNRLTSLPTPHLQSSFPLQWSRPPHLPPSSWPRVGWFPITTAQASSRRDREEKVQWQDERTTIKSINCWQCFRKRPKEWLQKAQVNSERPAEPIFQPSASIYLVKERLFQIQQRITKALLPPHFSSANTELKQTKIFPFPCHFHKASHVKHPEAKKPTTAFAIWSTVLAGVPGISPRSKRTGNRLNITGMARLSKWGKQWVGLIVMLYNSRPS